MTYNVHAPTGPLAGEIASVTVEPFDVWLPTLKHPAEGESAFVVMELAPETVTCCAGAEELANVSAVGLTVNAGGGAGGAYQLHAKVVDPPKSRNAFLKTTATLRTLPQRILTLQF